MSERAKWVVVGVLAVVAGALAFVGRGAWEMFLFAALLMALLT